MKKRIFSSIFVVSLALIVFITAIVTGIYYSSYCDTQINQLREESQLVIRGVELNGSSYLDSMSFDNYRITWIKDNGTVIYDSSSSEELENHIEREEVQEALKDGYGESKRYSSTILKESIYVAYKIDDGSIIRLSCVQNSVFYLIISTLYPIYYVVFAALIIAILLAFFISKKMIDPLNKLDLNDIKGAKTYPEIEPLIKRIENQRKQLILDKTEIEKASLVRQEFTANVTHEMKTPLQVISGYSELIKEGIVKESEIREFSSKIYFESHRLTKLVDDILELSKLDNGVSDSQKKQISLDFIAKNVIDSLNDLASQKGVTIKSRLQSVEVLGIPEIIHSVIYNLVDNAIKYNKKNGEITLVVEMSRNKPTIIVSDTGLGIPNDQLDRIFERFYRVDKSRSREIGGTGLGLSIVKHGVLIHDAKIKVESTLNQGTTFTIEF